MIISRRTSCGHPDLKWLIILAACMLFGAARLCSASSAGSLSAAVCAPNLSGIFPNGYEAVYQPADDGNVPLAIKQEGSNDLCLADAYPPQILPAFSARIIGTYKKGFILAFPSMAPESRFFLKSLAKLGWSYYETDRYALVKDKAEIRGGEMDSIPASGMYALALSAAQKEHLVSKDEAVRVLRKIYGTVSDVAVMPRAYGILPHFVKWQGNRYSSLAEYSTVDTALYYHSMLIASEILGQTDIFAGLMREIGNIDFGALTIKSGPNKGFITMGIDRGGRKIFKDSVWRYWGGESALVLLLAKLSGDAPVFHVSDNPDMAGSGGNVFAGRGFIAEIQSLFYPQFDSALPDRLTGQDWLAKRRRLTQDQIKTTIDSFPGSKAAEYKLYGYSCGEIRGKLAAGCGSYCENGIKDGKNKMIKPHPVIFPHYILMSSQSSEHPGIQVRKLEILERKGLFPPWGLVESCGVNLKNSLPMMGSLNASFEAISAYHLLAKISGKPDVIYDAARQIPALKKAVGIFY